MRKAFLIVVAMALVGWPGTSAAEERKPTAQIRLGHVVGFGAARGAVGAFVGAASAASN